MRVEAVVAYLRFASFSLLRTGLHLMRSNRMSTYTSRATFLAGKRVVSCIFVAAMFSISSVAFAASDFVRGDSNSDGRLDIADGIHVLGYLFLGASAPSCFDAADANDDGAVDIADVTEWGQSPFECKVF